MAGLRVAEYPGQIHRAGPPARREQGDCIVHLLDAARRLAEDK